MILIGGIKANTPCMNSCSQSAAKIGKVRFAQKVLDLFEPPPSSRDRSKTFTTFSHVHCARVHRSVIVKADKKILVLSQAHFGKQYSSEVWRPIDLFECLF